MALAARQGDAAVDRGRLAGAGGVPDEADLGQARGEREHAGGGVVVGAVVDVDDLVGGEGLAGGDDGLGDEVDVLGFVLQRHDDGEPGQSVCGDMGGPPPGPPHSRCHAPTGAWSRHWSE